MTAGAKISGIGGTLRKVGRWTAYGPFGRLYARSFYVGVVMQVLAVMALVEAVFLAERFPMVFREVLKNNADLSDTALIFVLNSTQIFDVALAIAILMAVYWTTLRMRESRELLVLFSAGTGPYQLTALILAIAIAAQIASLTISGVLDPASRFAQREILFDAEFRALRIGINTGQFYHFPNRVAFAPVAAPVGRNTAASDQTKKLFVYEQTQPGTFRVITAERARLDGPDQSGAIRLNLHSFTSRTFSDTPPPAAAPAPSDAKPCTDCGGDPSGISRMALSAHDITQEITLNELLTFLPRGSKPEELTIFEQFAEKAGSASASHRKQMRLLGERFARSLLCLLAPLIAFAAVCLTSRATDYVVLPLACMALMSLNVTSEWLIRTLAPTDPLGALGVPSALTAAFAVLLLGLIIRKQGELVRPQLARP